MTRTSRAALLALLIALPLAAQDRERGREDPAASRDLPPVVIPPARDGVRYLRALVFGDWGIGSPGQRAVADAMAKRAEAEPVDALITTGDNFYPRGVASVQDPHWRATFEEVYAQPSLQVPVYPCLGNHDWGGDVQAQVAYGGVNPRWRLPATYHAWSWPEGEATPVVQLFVLDTTPMLMRGGSAEQLRWLDEQLGASTARWKVVYGHHPIHSNSRHGDTPTLKQTLEPILIRRQVDLYMAGHDHALELFKPIQGVHHLVSGGGGGPEFAYPITWSEEEDLYAATLGGFVALRVGPDELVIEFVRMDARTQFAHTLIKGTTGPF
jgi:tartrate-resistant acid phosphatase type 5